MSGSSDRFSGRPPHPDTGVPDYDPYLEPLTGPPTGRSVRSALSSAGPELSRPLPAAEEAPREMYAPARDAKDRARKMKTTAPVVPPGSVTGRSLTLVISIMCFLACLTAGAVWMIKQSSDAWMKDIASEVTVQVEPQDKGDTEKRVADVVGFVEKQAGIASAKALTLEDSAALLEPWLGTSDALKSLPVPRLIAIRLDRANPPDLDQIGETLKKEFKGVTLDDHRRWQQQIRAVTRSFALGGIAILLLVAAATTAVIVSATKSAMASNRDIVEVLHFVGATDKFIAREFEKHFLSLGIKAGIVGAGAAMVVFLGMPAIMELMGGGVSAVEMQRLVGAGMLDAAGYVVLGLVVIIIAGLCMVTSRVGVYRILNSQH